MVKIPGSADIQQVGLSNRMRTTQAREVGAEGAALQQAGMATNEIANRIREQTIDSQLLQADLEASKIIDQRMAELRTRDDWEKFETDGETIARDAMNATRPKFAGLRGQQAWSEATSRRIQQTRQRAQTLGLQRGTELAVASVEAMRSQALMVIQDDAATPEQIAEATTKALTAAGTARARGFMGADDVERMRSALEGAAGERARRVARETAVVGYVSKAAEVGAALDERLSWVSENVPPQYQELVNDRVAQAWSRENAAREARRKETLNEAWGLVYEGTLPDQMPAALRDQLDGDDKIRMRDYLETRWRQQATREGAGAGDNQLFAQGIDAARNNPRSFARVDLEQFRSRLNRTQFQRLERLQETTRGDLESGRLNPEASLTTRMQRMAQQAAVAGGRELDADQKRALNGHVARLVLEWSDSNEGNLPDDKQQRAIVTAALTPARNNRYVFEASDSERVRVPYKDIPVGVRNRLIEEARAASGASGYGSLNEARYSLFGQVSQQEIEERYADYLALRSRGSR